MENKWIRRESVCQSQCRVAQEKYLEERGFWGFGGFCGQRQKFMSIWQEWSGPGPGGSKQQVRLHICVLAL